jgi:alkylation response protein AidB-like acyl-CoA dehydrogenase
MRTIGTTDEHRALAEAVAGWLERHTAGATRARLDAATEDPPDFWAAFAAQGWLGLHLPEAAGGSGFGLLEAAVVAEQLGRALTCGPAVPTMLAAAVASAGRAAGAGEWCARLADGTTIGAIALAGCLDAEKRDDGSLWVSGRLRPVLAAHHATLLVAPTTAGWVVLTEGGFGARELPSLDPTRRVAEVEVSGTVVGPAARLAAVDDERVRDLAAVLLGAELVGVAQWCTDTAADHARTRVQFGRPIGQFQGVKHRVANMLGRTELARAAVWDAARAVGTDEAGPASAAAAAALAVEAAVEGAKDCIQVLGGLGFTWEHDAHVALRRALVGQALLGPPGGWRRRAAELAAAGVRRNLELDLGADAEALRAELRPLAEELAGLGPADQRRRLAEAGLIAPQWPRPWGRGAGPVEQLVIDQELRRVGVRRPRLTIAAWALPPLIVYGSEAQQRRWIPPTLRGEIEWCQLFSEPDAGSDLASLTTRAVRVEGGWVVTGQKVWTTLAQQAQWGILLARTDPEAPKHEGISFFMLDMASPGITVRPLRELTGHALFNEVFLDEVFVPEDCLVGREHDGWQVARTTLANERVFMGSGGTVGAGVRGLLELLERGGRRDDPAALETVGELVTRDHALAVLGFRLTLAALGGADPSPSEASVRKLLGVEHDQRVQDAGVALLGAPAAVADGEAATWTRQLLFNRQLTIAGGTSEIQRNIIAERSLGLPKDP